jgi:hypothetical protein
MSAEVAATRGSAIDPEEQMKRQIAFAAALAASVAASAVMQAQTQQRAPATDAAEIVTVTGCVQSGASPTTPTSTAGANAAPSFILAHPVMGPATGPGLGGVPNTGNTTTAPGAGTTGVTSSTSTTSPNATPATPMPRATEPSTSAPSTTTPPTQATATTPAAPGSPVSPQAGMSTPGTAGTTGATPPASYRLAGGEPDTLKSLQNQRVEVRGMFDTPNPAAAPSGSSMRTLRITSIRPVAGDCGAAQ